MNVRYSHFLLFFIIVLLVLSGCLFRQGRSYKLENRALILQNDSLISVNIELTRRLQRMQYDSVSHSKFPAGLINNAPAQRP